MRTDPDALHRLQRWDRVTAGSTDGYWERNLRTNVSWYSPSFRTLFGFGPDELPDDRDVVNARIHPDDLPGFLHGYQQALASNGRFRYELRFLDARGQWRWVRGRGQVWPGADGQPHYIAGAVSDVQAEQEARQSLEALKQRFESAIDASAEGLFERIVGEEALYMSDRYLQLIGNRRDEVPPLRSAILARFHPDDLAHALAVNRVAEAGLQRWELLLRFRHANGEYRWYRQRGIAERMPDGRTKVTGMIADVHEQVLQRQELERTQAQLEALVAERTAKLEAALALAQERQLEAERANAAKSRFLAHMSHEIRTPLNGVLGLVELAQRVAQSPEQQRYLETAQRAGHTLAQVINTVLDFSRIEAGRAELRPRPFDLAQALIETMRSVMPLVRERGLLMMFDWPEGPCEFVGDEVAIRQIATNLIGNAGKFTQRGWILVTGQARLLQGDQYQVEVSVADSGPGIAPGLRERVFDAFVQGDDSLTRSHGGTGLGLPIAQGLAQAMGGEISLATPDGGGSRFTLRLPLAVAPGALRAPPAGANGMAWLVSTTEMGGAWLSRRMQRAGWHIRILPSIEALLQAAQEGPAPRLVLLSEFALFSGLDLGPVRRALPGVAIRLIVRPDWHEPQLEAHARTLGMTSMLTPMSPRDLLHLADVPPSAEDTLPPAGATQPPAWPPGTRVLLVEDNPVNQLIGQEFLRVLGLQVRTVADGALALQACVEEPPALVLMDLQMPGMDGLEAARRLRVLQREGAWPGAPIVALTAHAGAADRAACLAAGMDGVLTKPLTLQQLREELGHYLGRPGRSSPG
ncbi:PAS domain-containing protein [Aquabacterium sp.]|uniref:PAS domain-containing hybrid sensor histidine kinase/response regulator n=1 Tax=Aquabacterium sp. TaxID=1872578 RepID=UPI003783D2F6